MSAESTILLRRVDDGVVTTAVWPLSAMRDALSAAGWVVEQGWQPIETAPKDDWIYVWHAKHKWLRIGRKFGGAGPRWYFSGHVPGGAQYGDGDEAPTHWRPLPAAPQEDKR